MSTTPTRASGDGYARGRAARERLIDEATKAFAETGYHGASLRDIAARAGMTHAGLKHHFGTKTELMMAVLLHRDEVDSRDVEADFDAGLDWIEAIIRLAERNSTRRPLVELFAVLSAEAGSPHHPAHLHFAHRYRRTLSEATQAFSDAITDGRVRPEIDPAVAGRNWVALMDGLQVQWLLTVDGPPEQRVDMAAHLRASLDSMRPSD